MFRKYYNTRLWYNVIMKHELLKKKQKQTLKQRKSGSEKDRVDARREEVLARGRKFKYPLQYAKHKLVVNTIIVAVVMMVGLFVLGWAALYKFQDMGDIMYRISSISAVPVAEIDGKKVRFSDYLMIARSSLTTLRQQSGVESNSEDEKAMENRYKRSALTQAEDLTYALKLGSENNIEVTKEDVKKSFDEHRKVGGAERSEESFLKVLSSNFGLTKSEYERMLYLALVKARVSEAIDTEANATANEVQKMLGENGGDFVKVKEALGDRVQYETTGGLVDNKNVDGGRSDVASSLEPGKYSGRFLSSNGDGYYFVKLIEKKDNKLSYESLYVKFTEFDKRLANIRAQGMVKEYIKLESLETEEVN